MVEEIVMEWVDELKKVHNVDDLKDISKDIINSEIEETKCNIENCEMWNDGLGIQCNKEYLEILEVVLK